MRWKEKQYCEDSERRRHGFLFIPKRIHDDVRWLEYATWYERYYGAYLGWHPFAWDEKE